MEDWIKQMEQGHTSEQEFERLRTVAESLLDDMSKINRGQTVAFLRGKLWLMEKGKSNREKPGMKA